MRKILAAFVVLLILCNGSSYAQNAYNDALVLNAKYIKPARAMIKLDNEAKELLIKNYYKDKTVDDITAQFLNQNPFFNGLFADANAQGVDKSSFLSKSFNLSSVGDLDVTNLADGLAKFLVERAKEELSLAFFQKLKDDMTSDKWKEIRILFPQTYATLLAIDTRIYQYTAYLTELREAFIVDLKDLGYNVPTLIRGPGKIGDYFKTHPDFRAVVTMIAQVADVFIHEEKISHVGIMIEKLDPDHFFPNRDASDVVMNGSIKLLQLLSTSLISGDTTRYWVPVDSLTSFFGDIHTVRLYLGLLYTKSDGIDFTPDQRVTFKTMLTSLAVDLNTKVVPFANAISSWTATLSAYDNYWKYKKQQKNADSTAMYYYSMYTKSIDAISDGLKLARVFDSNFNPAFEPYLPAARTLGEVYIDAQQKKFSLAVLSLVQFLGQVKDAGYDSKLLEKLTMYGSFVAEVAQAENSDQVKDIIAKTVLPVGSSSIKKNSKFNIAVNAYLGGFYGWENIPDNSVKPWAKSAGVFAPIGVAFSIPFRINDCSWGSLSLYGSVLDLGAVASFRLHDNTTEKLPQLTLQNIFAPGAGLVWGLPKVPLSIGYMNQWGPQLRTITATSADLKQGSINQRRILFLAVDIPLLNIFNKPR